jgi:hypothetical protein
VVAGQYGAGQIIKTAFTTTASVALAMGLGVVKTPLDDLVRTTVWTREAIGPSQVAHRFKALGIIDEILDIDHGENPEEERKKKGAPHQE